MGYEAAVIGFLATFALMALKVPIGLSLGIVGVAGYAVMVGPMPALKLLALSPMRTASDLNFAVVPLFVVMGVLARESGISTDLFRACAAWLGQLRGGLALATIGASAGFAAICGSSVATAATMTKIALPEMRRHGYDDGVATGTIAAGGTLGILIPPSVPFLIYGILTENDIGKLFVAGILPGALATLLYMSVIFMISVRAPNSIPAGPATTWSEKLRSLKGVWASLAIFLFVIGGIYAGLFTALEAAGAGAAATLVVALLQGRLDATKILRSFSESVRVTGTLFTILIGAILFSSFLVVTGAPQAVATWLTGLPIGPMGVLVLMLLLYFMLGCFLDSIAMIIITVPILYPAIINLGFDPIWFGVLVVMACELGLITPPYGMNVFVINGVARDVGIPRIFGGVLPFIGIDIVRIAIIVAFPGIALLLPRMMG